MYASGFTQNEDGAKRKGGVMIPRLVASGDQRLSSQ